MKRLPEEKIKQIIDLYINGANPKEIGKQFGIMNNSVTRILRKNGVERNKLKKLTDDQISYIIEKYNNEVSSEQIAKELNINSSTVCRVLHRTGNAIRPSEDNKRIYKINQDYFSNIQSEEQAYILGFLYADGSLTEKYSITLTLNAKDIDILQKISNIIYGFEKINKYSKVLESGITTEYATLNIYSKKMVSDLNALGCMVNKTFFITLPKLKPELMRHFLRGYFDGDGCISLTEEKNRIDITSNIQFLADVKDYVLNTINVDFGKININKRNNKIGNIQISSSLNMKSFLDYIYSNSKIYLERKYNLYVKYLEIIKNKRQKKIDKLQDFSRYGTTYITDYNGNTLTGEYIKTLSDDEKHNISESIIPYYREHGFPYPKLTLDEIVKDYSLLCSIDPTSIVNGNKITLFNSTGSSLVKHFSPHFYEVKSGVESHKPSPLEVYNDDKLLTKVIYNRLSQNMALSGNMLRQGIINSNIGYRASSFNVLSAKYIYNKYLKDNSVIYDYSMGFGQRLLGALTLPYNVTYVGTDPLLKSVDSNNNMFQKLKNNIPNFNKKADLFSVGSEDFCDPKYINKVDLAFSSPPYFYLEVFEKDEKQCYFNKSYVDFINNWWRKTVTNITKLLKDDGLFIINIKDWVDGFHVSKDMLGVAYENNFVLEDTLYYQLTKNLTFKNKSGEHKYEPIYVLRKTSGQK